MPSHESRKEITPEDYHRAVVDAFLYYLSSHSREHADLLAQGVRQGMKEWLDQQNTANNQPIGLHTGEVTEFHEALEELYSHVDHYGRACREYGRMKAQAPAQFAADDAADVYEAEKQLKLKIERIVNENIRLRHMLETSNQPIHEHDSSSMFRSLIRDSMREWLNERKGE